MTTIKLGHNTYRVYNTAAAVSYLFLVKGSEVIIKRVDAPKSFRDSHKDYQHTMERTARSSLQVHLDLEAKFWTEQGNILSTFAAIA